MLSAALLSTFHVLALAIGLPSVVARARALHRLTKEPGAVEAVLFADNLWGIAALLWLGSGLLRAFGPFEKGSGYYLHSGAFLLKMALFVVVMLLELWPMATFIAWRIRRGRGLPLDTRRAGLFAKLTAAEVVFTLAIPFVASMMARGIGFTWFS
jgi:putative membrane protein